MINISQSIEIAFGIAFLAVLYNIAYHIKIINHEMGYMHTALKEVSDNVKNTIDYLLRMR